MKITLITPTFLFFGKKENLKQLNYIYGIMIHSVLIKCSYLKKDKLFSSETLAKRSLINLTHILCKIEKLKKIFSFLVFLVLYHLNYCQIIVIVISSSVILDLYEPKGQCTHDYQLFF